MAGQKGKMERKKLELSEVPAGDLAYLGDAVLEVLVREHLLSVTHKKGEHLSDMALEFVTAKAQSDAFSRVENLLTDDETAVFKRARNNYHTGNVPKSATPAQYRRATGFEALFGYLYLTGEKERTSELFKIAYEL